MTDLNEALRDVTGLLDHMGLTYAVMGGLAVRVHGIPRATYDIDFTLSIDRERLPELYTELRARGYTVPEVYDGGWVDQVAGMALVKFRLYLGERGIDVDVFLAESDYQRELLSRRQQHSVDGLTAWIVSAEDLILLKLVAGRPRDLADIGDVLFVQGRLDEAYLRRWADRLGVQARLDDALRDPPPG
jgi:predicted nucleotidyltransferase